MRARCKIPGSGGLYALGLSPRQEVETANLTAMDAFWGPGGCQARSGGLCALGLQSALTVVDAFSGPGYLSPKQRREQTLRAPLCGCRRAGLMTGLPACLLITLFLVFENVLSKGLRTLSARR